jgi:hypothetical protein
MSSTNVRSRKNFFQAGLTEEGKRERGGIIGGREGDGVMVLCVNIFRGYI